MKANLLQKCFFLLVFLFLGSAENSLAAITWNDLTHKFNWADTNVAQSVSTPNPIKKEHFIELREAIDYAMANSSCNVPNAWNGVNTAEKEAIGAPNTTIKASHVNSLHLAVRNLYTGKLQAAAIPAEMQAAADLSPGTPIIGVHVQDIRDALDGLVNTFCTTPPTVCGDGTLDAGEQCDQGAANHNGCGGCSLSCTNNAACATCGDGICEGSENTSNCAQDCGCVPAVALNAYASGGTCCRGDGACGAFDGYCVDARNPTAAAYLCKQFGYDYVLGYSPNPGSDWNCGGCLYELWPNASPAITSTTNLSTYSTWPTPSHMSGCDICRPMMTVYCSNISPAQANVVYCGNGTCDACGAEDASNCVDCAVCGDDLCSPGETCFNVTAEGCIDGTRIW